MDEDVVELPQSATRTFPSSSHATIKTIPPEILLYIFSYAIFTCAHPITSPRNSALSLSRVCSAWRTLVVQTGAFWTRITVDYRNGIPDSSDPAQAVLVWLSRAGQTRPLDITFFVPEEKNLPTEEYADILENDENEDILENEDKENANEDEDGDKYDSTDDYGASVGDEDEEDDGLGRQEPDDIRMIETAAALAPLHKRWRSFACCMSDSLLARLLPFYRVRGYVFCSRLLSLPFDFPILETLEISTFMGDSPPWRGSPDLLLQPFTASPSLTSVSFPRHESNLRVGVLPWSQLRRLHVNSPDDSLFDYGTLELTLALVQCSQLEDLTLVMDSMDDVGVNEPLPPFISPRQPLPALRIMTLVVSGYTYVAPTHLVESITTPSLETLRVSGREELDEDILELLDQSDVIEEHVSQIHSTFCRSVTALLQASRTKLKALHFTVFYADADSIWALFSAAADTLDTVSFRHGRSAVLDSMHNSPPSYSSSNIRWTVDTNESLRADNYFARLTEIEEISEIVFRRVWPLGDSRVG